MMNSNAWRQNLKRVAQGGRLLGYSLGDLWRFWRNASLSTFDGNRDQIASRIMYNVHALEKGLAHVSAWMPGRGRRAIRNLNDAMTQYRRRGYDLGAFEYIEGVSVMMRYQERHRDLGVLVDVSDIAASTIFAPEDPERFNLSGVMTVRKPAAGANAAKDFYSLSQGRVSIREFSGSAIDDAAVLRAIQNAQKTPSVCNRQCWRVYKTSDKQLVREVLSHQRGFAYEQMPETLLAVAASSSAFISPVERNQGFVDGGLYAMSILYGLEAEGLAAVPLNACLYWRDRVAITRLLRMNRADEIVMFIAVGDYPSETIVPSSDRRPVSGTLRLR